MQSSRLGQQRTCACANLNAYGCLMRDVLKRQTSTVPTSAMHMEPAPSRNPLEGASIEAAPPQQSARRHSTVRT